MYQLKDHKPAAELKGSAFSLTVVRLLSTELDEVERDLRDKLATGPRFFANAPIVLELDRVRDSQPELDFPALMQLLQGLALVPVGVRHATPAQQDAAIHAGFALIKGGWIRELPAIPGAKRGEIELSDDAQETDKSRGAGSEERVVLTAADQSSGQTQTRPLPVAERVGSVRAKTILRPVRSGQQVHAEGSDLVVLAPVNAGAEVVADGDIHIYGPLRGRALAGAQGDRDARIFCQNMGAELVAIAGRYQVLDESVPQQIRGRAAQVYLDGEQLRFELLA